MHPQTLYILIVALRSAGMSFMATSYVPYLLKDLHVRPAEVEFVNAAFLFSIFLFEIPTGLLADGRGRKWAIQFGLLCHGIGMTLYGCAIDFWTALAAEIVEGIAFAFLSGATTAWITDALHKRGESERIKTVFATEVMFTAGGFLVGSQIGHLLSLWSYRTPWLFGAAIQFITLLIAVRYLTDEGEPTTRVTERQAFQMAVERIKTFPGLRWGACASMAFGFVIPFNHFWSPYFRTFIPETVVGLAWAPLYAALAVSGWLAKRGALRDHRAEHMLVFALFAAGASLALMGTTGSFSGIMLYALIHEMARGLFRPHLELFFQKQFESSYRATAGSIQSFIQSCGYGVILLGVWLAMYDTDEASRETIAILFLCCGSLLCIATVLLFICRPRSAPKAQPVPSP